jgi:hypothetical protein
MAQEEEFVKFVKEEWRHFSHIVQESTRFQFAKNFIRFKKTTLSCTREVLGLERTNGNKLSQLYGQNFMGIFFDDEKAKCKDFEDNERKLLHWKEYKWRMKSTALSLAQRDEKAKFFQNYAKQRRH